MLGFDVLRLLNSLLGGVHVHREVKTLPEPPNPKSGDILKRGCVYLNPDWLNPEVLTTIKCAVNPCARCQDCDEEG